MRYVEQGLSAAVNSLIDKLAESNSSISAMVQQAAQDIGSTADVAAEHLAEADRKLGATASRFSQSAGHVADIVSGSTRMLETNIERMSEVFGQTLEQVGGIVSRFDEHSRVLSEASDLLGAAQSNLASTLDERQNALRSLAGGLLKRSEEIEGTMRNLTGLVDSAFEKAEERSLQVGSRLRESLHASFADIGRTLGETQHRAEVTADAMREALVNAGGDATRAIESTLSDAEKRTRDLSERMRGSISASLTDVERLLSDATDRSGSAAEQLRETLRQSVEEAINRFSGATDEIRRSAQDIRRELDTTRSELKRGAFDLPEEAKESAAAMRRAVAEQIKALQDISALVGRSTQNFEVSEASASRPAPAPARPQPAAPAPVPPQPAPPAPRSDTYGASSLRGALPLDRPAQTPASRAPEPAPRGGNASDDGWISNLLRGASRDELGESPVPRQQQPVRTAEPAPAPRSNGDNRNPRHMVESLNSLSVDIARAIDHDASVDLWRRYQRGERDVFTRRLYTLKGQQTFDEIKRKYEREPEFRTAVDRYIADFEKLLADVARTDRDKTVTQSYLTSDTGKVYTMLAHAAGRFN